MFRCLLLLFFFFNDTATTEIYTLSLHDALPISSRAHTSSPLTSASHRPPCLRDRSEEHTSELQSPCNLVCRLLLEKNKNISFRLLAGAMGYHNIIPLIARVVQPALESNFFFFKETATPEIYTLSLHAALPIYLGIPFGDQGFASWRAIFYRLGGYQEN